ncbi:hypothetical protein [Schumannella luteola]
MTTFQDQQPQSRRAARQSERAENAEPAVGVYSDPSAPREMWDTTARRAAQLQQPSQPASGPQGGGRRAAAPAGEPLDYVTQQKPPIPTYDGPSFRPRGATPEPSADALPPTQAMPVADRPAFRPRDFSPEGRRSAAPEAPVTAIPGWTEPIEPLAAADLDYHTEGRVAPSAAVAPSVPEAPIAAVPPTIAAAPVTPAWSAEPPISEIPENVAPEHTLTRRELRALQAAEAAAAVPELQEPPRPEAPAPADEAQAWPFANLVAGSAPSATEPPAAPAPEAAQPFSTLPASAPEPEPNTGLTNALNEFDWLAGQHDAPSIPPVVPAAPEPAPAPAAEEAAPWTPPQGHWSTQLQQDDPSQPIETTLSRTVGTGSATTSALVLPIIPDGDIRGPLTGTGEIMLTGSIDLPHTLAATGASARLEHEGIDRLFESHDAELVSTDSAPVSAIKAVSTQSGSNIGHAPKPKGNRALTALLIAAASMAVVVVGLLVVALAVGVF